MSSLIRISVDITDICSSPQLFAAYHVLHRLLVPRHSPYALLCLISSFSMSFFLGHSRNCSSNNVFITTTFAFLMSFLSRFLQLCSFQGTLHLLPQMVGSSGLEPPTSRLSGVRSNQLSYEPILVEMNGFEPMASCLQGRRSPN